MERSLVCRRQTVLASSTRIHVCFCADSAVMCRRQTVLASFTDDATGLPGWDFERDIVQVNPL